MRELARVLHRETHLFQQTLGQPIGLALACCHGLNNNVAHRQRGLSEA